MNWTMIISGLLAASYIVFVLAHDGFVQGLKVVSGLILPLCCIWFPEAMGRYTGPTTRSFIDTPSPGWMVRILGWLVLLIPLFIWIVFALSNRP